MVQGGGDHGHTSRPGAKTFDLSLVCHDHGPGARRQFRFEDVPRAISDTIQDSIVDNGCGHMTHQVVAVLQHDLPVSAMDKVPPVEHAVVTADSHRKQ